ncbi:hypothetical protein D9M70_388360 [compost metagenome]
MGDLVHPRERRAAHRIAAHQVGGGHEQVLALGAALDQRRSAVRAASFEDPGRGLALVEWLGHELWASVFWTAQASSGLERNGTRAGCRRRCYKDSLVAWSRSMALMERWDVDIKGRSVDRASDSPLVFSPA